MSQDSEDEWEIVEDELIELYIKEKFSDVSEPKYKKNRERHHMKMDYWNTCWGH